MLLMHKDKKVARFTVYENRPFEIQEIFDESEMPIGLKGTIEFANKNLLDWCASRAIPEGRMNIHEIKSSLEIHGGLNLVSLKSLKLSLNDTYWYKPEDSDITWDEVDLKRHKFTAVIYQLETSNKITIPGLSPDFTTDGALKKFWVTKNKSPYLLKSGEFTGITNGSGILAANEIVATKISQLMNIDVVNYSKTTIEGSDERFSMCECFVKPNEDLVTGQDILNQIGADSRNMNKLYDYLVSIGLRESIDKLIALDVLVHNHDRHANNIAILLDSDTGEITRFAPVYDTGSCLAWNGVTNDDNMKFPVENRKECLDRIINKIDLPAFDKLETIIRDVYKDFNISEKQTDIAIDELKRGYDYIEEFNRDPQKGLGFDLNDLFER